MVKNGLKIKQKRKKHRAHARRRLLSRYGLEFTNEMENSMIRQIQSGDGSLVEKQTNRVSVWSVDHDGENYNVAYDKLSKSIITFLYPEEFCHAD